MRAAAACAGVSWLSWAPLAAAGHWLGARIVVWCTGSHEPEVQQAWLADASEANRLVVQTILLLVPVVSFGLSALTGGAAVGKMFPGVRGRVAGAGGVVAAIAAWILTALRLDAPASFAALGALAALGFAFAWAGHRLARRDRLDESPSRR